VGPRAGVDEVRREKVPFPFPTEILTSVVQPIAVTTLTELLSRNLNSHTGCSDISVNKVTYYAQDGRGSSTGWAPF
jgi:hypothetical protein